MKGSLETKRNAPLKLADSLQQDLKLRRFNFLTFDLDEPETVRTIRGQIRKGNVVGAAFPHDPDFEFANFDLSELVEIAATIDDQAGLDGSLVRGADWSGVVGARAFEKRYSSASSRHRPLKGIEWGTTLAKYALAHPLQRSGKRRPFLESIDTVLQSRIVRYDYHKAVYSIDPDTFAIRRVAEPDDPWRL